MSSICLESQGLSSFKLTDDSQGSADTVFLAVKS